MASLRCQRIWLRTKVALLRQSVRTQSLSTIGQF